MRSSWGAVVELVTRLAKLDLLPPGLESLLENDVWGGAGLAGAPGGNDGGGEAAAAAEKAVESQKGGGAKGGAKGPGRRPRHYGAGVRAAKAAAAGGGGGFLSSVTKLIALQVRFDFGGWRGGARCGERSSHSTNCPTDN